MNYAWARDYALELINQYSIAGQKIPESYNNQADYTRRIPKLLDDAQMYAATTSGRIRALMSMDKLKREEMGEWTLFKLPGDCWRVCSGGVLRTDGPALHRFHRYRVIGGKGVAIHKSVDGEMILEYFRYPELLGPEPKEDAPLDNTPEVQMALPYYVAAHLVMQDNAFAYQSLCNEFEAKLARLGEVPQAEVSTVEDAYDPGEWEYNA